MPSSLQVSLVVYYPEEDELIRSLHSLANAIEFARSDGTINSVNVALIDNSQNSEHLNRLVDLAQLFFRDPIEISFLSGHANIGLGGAMNLSLHGSGADYHLLLTVNIELQRDAIAEAISWMQANEDTGLATGAVYYNNGSLKSPCFQYPTMLDALLYYIAPVWVKRLFASRCYRFQMIETLSQQQTSFDVPCLAHGCLIARRTVTDQSGGFDPAFFLYFGDWDLSLRLSLIARTVYLPQVRAIAHPPPAQFVNPSKNLLTFFRDLARFFRKHHCRWW